jgi:3-methyladenine DNA glycosylase AlkD
MKNLALLRAEIKKAASRTRAKNLSWFFKTGPGEYGEGDVFIGLSVPQCRALAKKFSDISFSEKQKLLGSKVHEERMIALLMFLREFEKGDDLTKKKVFKTYLGSTKYINNWDLVDLTAPRIVGITLCPQKNCSLLTRLANSKSLWERRISVLATFWYIKNNEFSEPLRIAKILLYDTQDLIQKAVGWMLREVGNKSLKTEKDFLKKYYKTMPRTALRYAIEKFPKSERVKYLQGIL